MTSRKPVAAALGALLAAAGLALVPSASPAQAGPAPAAAPAVGSYRAAPIAWSRCRDRDLRRAKAQCGRLTVPLDHANPTGPTIELAVSRVLHTKKTYRGAVFTNPGGPGGSGLRLSTLGTAVPHGVGKSYDWYGIDPRGVGDSRPLLSCNPRYRNKAHQPYQPRRPEVLSYWLAKTEGYAADCAASASKDLLPHMRTTDIVEDFEALRIAIGQAQVTWYGFSYGTYIGQVWATLHPGSLKAMVLDGVVDAGRVWYRSNFDQDYAFDKVYSKFFRWVGRYWRSFHLGRTGQDVDARIAKLRRSLGREPLRGKVGAAEVDDALTVAGYANAYWPDVANVLAELANERNIKPIRSFLGRPKGKAADNGYVGYLATECTDAPWPKDWSQWASDTAIVDRDAPYIAWANTWFNAPCRTWPAPSGTPVSVSGSAFTGPVLLINETFDAATPFSGALATRALFPTSRLVEGRRGTTHSASLSGVSCVDDAVARVLRTGALPTRKPGSGPDKTCPGLRPPRLGQQDADRSTAARALPRAVPPLG